MSREPDVDDLVLVARSATGLEDTAAACDGGKQVELIAVRPGGPRRHPGPRPAHPRRHGTIDVLLNIAGYAEPKSLLDTTADNLVTTFTVNVFAMLLLTREAVRHMQAGRRRS